MIAFGVAVAGSPSVLHAQVVFNGVTATYASYSSSDSISPLAVDSNGDIFYVVASGTTNVLYEIPAGGSAMSLNNSFPYFPSALAVNPSGTALYMIYSSGGASCNGLTYQRVSMVSTGANSAPADLQQCFTNFGYSASYTDPTGLATDASGNLYVADFGAGVIWKITATVSAGSHPTYMMDLYQQPYDIAVLGSTIYYTALNTSSVDTLYSVSASNFTTGIPSGGAASASLASIDSIQQGLAAASSGSIFVGTSTSIQQYSGGTVKTYVSVPGGVTGLGLDSSNNLYLDGQDSSGNPFVGRFSGQALNFGSVNVGTTSSASSLSFTIAGSGSTTVGSVHVYTQGTDNLDFTDAGNSTCTPTTYASSSGCDVNVHFDPRFPGLRLGAVSMFDGSGNLLVTVPVYGTGLGPQIAFLPPAASTIGSGLSSPGGAAVDGAGNVYIADSGNNRVLKQTLSGSNYSQTVLFSGLSDPDGLAADGAGNLYIADSGNNRVLKETPAGSGYSQTTIGSGLTNPKAVAVDGSGDLYIADTGNNRILKETLSAGTYTQTTVGSGLSAPAGIAVDASGNLYIGDSGNSRVLKETLSSGSYTQTVVTSGLNVPAGVAVDASGDLYIADSGNDRVLRETLSGGSYAQSTMLSGLSAPAGLALDGRGDLVVCVSGNSSVAKETVVTPPSLSFASTSVGVQSADSPQSLTVANNGNAQLIFPIPGSGQNPSVASGFTLDSSTTCPELATSASTNGTLAAGASCVYGVDFIPVTSGSISGSVVLRDNNLNAAAPGYTTQSVSLSGTASQITISPSSLSAATVANFYFQSFSAANGTAPYTFSISSGTLPPGLNLSSGGALSGTPTAGGTFTFAVNVTDAGSNSSKQSYTMTVNAALITLSPATLPGGTVGVSYSQTITVGGGTAPYTLAITAGSLPAGISLSSAGVVSGTPTASGNYAFTVTAADSSSGTGPYTGSQAYALTISRASTTTAVASAPNPSSVNQTVTLSATITTAGSAGTAITGTVSFEENGSPISGCGAAVVTFTAGAGTASCAVSALNSGTHSITAMYSGDPQYLSSSGTVSQVVNKAGTSAGLTASANPSTFGQTVTFTATVRVTSGGTAIMPITGTVAFEDGANAISGCSAVPVTFSGGAATADCATAALTGGVQSITVVYSGDSNYLSTTSAAVSQTVNPAATVTSISSSLNPSTYSQPVTITATIAPGAGGTLPAAMTGSVAVLADGSAVSGCSAVSVSFSAGSGTATAACTTSALAGGTHSITAVYSGDSDYAGSASSSIAQSVSPAVTTTALSSSTNPSVYAQTVTLTATVLSGGSAVSAGSITFQDGTTVLGTAALSSGGTATLTATGLVAGTHALEALYAGNTDYQSSSSSTLAQTVNPVTLTIMASNATRIYGTANPAFSGSVSGAVNGDTFAESFSTTATAGSNVGSYPIVPLVTGTNLSDYTVVADNGTLTITQASTTTTLAASSAAITPGQNVTLTAAVASATTGTPSGTVSFYDGSVLLNAATLSGGVATYSTSSLAAGSTNVITAVYGGDINFTASSASTSPTISVSPLDFTVSVSGPGNPAVIPGSTLSYQVTVTPTYGLWPGAVTLAVSGLPAGAQATFSPATLTAGSGQQNSTLSIKIPAATSSANYGLPLSRRFAPVSLALLLLPFARRLRRHGRHLRRLSLILLLIAGLGTVATLTGCGSPNGFFDQTQKSYTATITATSGSFSHTSTITFSVQ